MGKKDKNEKPLGRMTAMEFRKYALDMGGITVLHGMNKEELLAAIKEAKGIVDKGKKAVKTENLRALKVDAYVAGESNKKIDILRRRMNRLKKRTRKAA